MSSPPVWSRLKNAHLSRVLAVYLGASWVVVQVVEVFQDGLNLPDWLMPVSLLLLVVGLVIVLVTAWIQSDPGMEAREAAGEVPDDWQLDLSDAKESLAHGRLPHLNWARTLVGGVFAFSLLFGAAGLYVVVKDRGRSFQPPEVFAGEAGPSLAVLPFLVSGSELEEWGEGMADLLSTGLDGAAGLRSVDTRSVLSRWDQVASGNANPDLETMLGVARSTGARFALEGSVNSIGSEARLVARVHDLESGERLGIAQVDGSLDAPHDLVDRLSVEVLGVLLGGDAEVLYLRAENYYHGGSKVISAYDVEELFRQAIELEPGFAPYRIHYVEMGFRLHMDSELASDRARELLDAIAGTADADDMAARYDRTTRLLYGSEAVRTAALDSIPTWLETPNLSVPTLEVYGGNVLAFDAWTATAREVARLNTGAVNEATTLRQLDRALVDQGRFAEALELLERPAMRGSEQWPCVVVDLRNVGAQVPENVLREAAEYVSADDATFRSDWCGAVIAADQGYADLFDRGLARLPTLVADGANFGLGDPVGMVRAYGDWRLGRKSPADAAHDLAASSSTQLAPYWIW